MASENRTRASKVLAPLDGSPASVRIVDRLLHDYRDSGGAAIEIHFLNVQPPLISGHVRLFASQDEIEAFRREEGLKALGPARAALAAAGVPAEWHVAVGHVADTILHYAEKLGAERILMGRRGSSVLADILLGSVASEVSRRAPMPVDLVD